MRFEERFVCDLVASRGENSVRLRFDCLAIEASKRVVRLASFD